MFFNRKNDNKGKTIEALAMQITQLRHTTLASMEATREIQIATDALYRELMQEVRQINIKLDCINDAPKTSKKPRAKARKPRAKEERRNSKFARIHDKICALDVGEHFHMTKAEWSPIITRTGRVYESGYEQLHLNAFYKFANDKGIKVSIKSGVKVGGQHDCLVFKRVA